MSNKDRRDENGDSNCTGEVGGSMRKCVYSMEDLDSAAKVFYSTYLTNKKMN